MAYIIVGRYLDKVKISDLPVLPTTLLLLYVPDKQECCIVIIRLIYQCWEL